jgi:hypothetical protein
MKNWIILVFVFAISSCFDIKHEGVRVTLQAPFEDTIISKKFRDTFPEFIIGISENTLDDTIAIGLLRIPPKKTGKFVTFPFGNDSFSYKVENYKAKKGNITIGFYGSMY